MANLVNVKSVLASMCIEAEIVTINKNGTSYEGLRLGKGKIQPVVYNEYEDDKEMTYMCVKAMEDISAESDIDSITNWEYAKDKVRIFLRRPTNDGALARKFLDLEVCCEVIIELGNETTGSGKISESLLDNYGITEDELFETALNNSVYTSMSLERKMRMLMGFDDDEDLDDSNGLGFIVVSNEEFSRGAGVLYKADEIKRVAEQNETDYWIIPSSIHEVLLLPMDKMDYDSCRGMLRDVNNEEVAESELLSYTLYKYERKVGEVQIA